VFDQDLRARFEWLREPDPEAVATPPLFMAFDVLCRNDFDLSRLSLRERRAQLEDLVRGSPLVFPVRRVAPNGLHPWQRCSRAALRAWWLRTTRAHTRAGRRSGG